MSDWQFSRPAIVGREVTARLFGPPFRWYMEGPRVSGTEHLRDIDRPFVVCPNHLSHADFSALRLALGPRHRRRLVATAAADYWTTSRWRAFISAWLGAMAFHRHHSGGAESIRAVEGFLAQGWNVVIFPEGTRSRTGRMGPFKPGVGLVASRTGRPVVPARIVGTYELLPPGRSRPRRQRVEVRFGPPLRAGDGEDPRAFTARLEAAVRAL